MVSRIEAEQFCMSAALTDQSAPDITSLHPALLTMRDRYRAGFVHLLAYASGLAVLSVLLADLFAGTPAAAVAPVQAKLDWIAASRPHPAFTISHLDLSGISAPYQILRHPDGSRKDTLRWSVPAGSKTSSDKPATEKPMAEIEIYRPGAELTAFVQPEADIAARIGLPDDWSAEAAGVINSKFGPVALLRFTASGSAPTCLGFAKNLDNPRVQISGWSCQPATVTALRAYLGCTLDRLVLLSAGNDPKLAGLFARAELRRTGCGAGSPPAGDWIAAAQEPALRGRI